MSTRYRVLLRSTATKEVLFRGVPAICELERLVKTLPIFERSFSSRKDRILQAAKKLPKEYEIVLIQQPKRTRKKRSLCFKCRQEQPQVKGAILRAPNLQDLQEIQYPIAEIAEEIFNRRRIRP